MRTIKSPGQYGADRLARRRNRFGYIFILPLILGVVFVFLPNIIQTLRYSLSDMVGSDIGNTKLEGFRYYYEALFVNSDFVPMLLDNISQLIIRVPVILIYSLFISTLLNQKFHGRVLARILFFVPVILSSGILSIADSSIMNRVGAAQAIDTGSAADLTGFDSVTSLLMSLNLPDFLTNVITDAIDNIYTIARASGLQIFIFLAGLQEIPLSLYEAASVEGCSKWELFWKITFPMIAPQIAINFVYTIADACITDNGVLDYTKALAFNENQYPLAMAMNILYLLCLGLLVIIILALMRRLTSKTS